MTAMMRAVLLLAILCLRAVPVQAQAPRLHESVIVSGSAEPVPFESVGRAVWVLTRADISRLPVRSVEDILRFASSVDVRARNPFVQADLSIRGGSFGQTLVLVDGLRLNDAQSGHHNSDFPFTLDDIERVEVLLGAGSSLFGADAFGGTINIITREASARPEMSAVAGEYGLAGARARASFGGSNLGQTVSAEVIRSSGFEKDRDFENVAVSSRTRFGPHTRVLVGFVRKDFGAAGFYGPAPSRETTAQFMAAGTRAFTVSNWRSTVQAMYRTHGDHFLYDHRQPGLAENVHRTHAATVVARANRTFSQHTRASVGTEIGSDWLTSSNLGDRSVHRASGFFEIQRRVGPRLVVYPGLRFDAYDHFGNAWSPSAAARLTLGPALSLRASAGRAFRVPTFTERYYTDPNHRASSDLSPEHGWNAEAGADWVLGPRAIARATVFTRREHDVIDWVRAVASERWRTTNIRRVEALGGEAAIRHLVGSTSFVEVQYTRLSTDAESVAGLLSKYVLDYASHNVVVSGILRGPLLLDLSPRVGWTRRNDGRSYPVVDVRASRAVRGMILFVEAANLLDRDYYEVPGVAMPGRWVSAGLRIAPAR